MLLLPEQIRSPHQPGKEQLEPSLGGRLGRDMPGLRTETQTEPFWQPQNGVRAGQGSLLGENSTAGPPSLVPNPILLSAARTAQRCTQKFCICCHFITSPPPSTSSQLASTVINKYINLFKTARTKLALGSR